MKSGDLYLLHTLKEEPREETVNVASKATQLELWHHKFAHLNEASLKQLLNKEMVRGLSFNKADTLQDCKICIQGKQTSTPFSKKSNFKSNTILELIHSDLFGPIEKESLGGSRYCATFTDDKSRYIEVFFLKRKDEVKDAFIRFKSAIEKKTGHQIKTLRTDNGLEYTGPEFDEYLAQQGIRREKSAPFSPQSNGISERVNRTLIEMARCLLIQANLPVTFWSEAAMTACHIRNRSPCRSLETFKTPYEIMFGTKPCVSYFKIFGQKAYILNKNHKRKFDVRSKEHIFVGYSLYSKAYRFYDPETRKIYVSRNAKFIEEFTSPSSDTLKSLDAFPALQVERESIRTADLLSEENFSPPDDVSDTPTNDETETGQGRPGERKHPMVLRSTSQTSPPTADQVSYLCEKNSCNNTIEDLLKGPKGHFWTQAMQEEWNCLTENNAWEIVNRPTDKKILRSQWVFREKFDQLGNISKYKARLVADGSIQKLGVDYVDNYSPVIRLSTLRTLLSYAAEKGLIAFSADFTLAYINGKLEREIFMEIPKGFEHNFETNKVCLLKRSIYGLKDSGLVWYQTLDKKLKSMQFKPLNSDKCVYKSETSEIYLLLYVDDLIVLCNSESQYRSIIGELSSSFKLKDLGKLSYCLGIQFSQNNDSISMCQTKYINDLLIKFNMLDCKSVVSPLDPNLKLSKEMSPQCEEEIAEMKDIPYRQLIGSLMYLSVATRPDITHAVNFLSQFNNAPGKSHWIAAKHVLRYLKGTKNLGIVYKRTGKPLVAYVDSDWASCIDDRKSQTGFIFQHAGSPISWESRKQRSVALSTCESEYMALSECAKESIHQRNLLGELNPDLVKSPITILCDNQSAIKLVKNPVFHNKTKHIDIRYHFIRDLYEYKSIEILYVNFNENCADILTKPLNGQKHNMLCKLVGLDCI